MNETLILVIGLVIVCLGETLLGIYNRANETKRLRAESAAERGAKQQHDDLLQVLVEKFTGDPSYMAQIHSAERSRRDAYRTSLDREAIKHERPAPPETNDPNYDRDGIPTTDLDAARR